MTTPSTTSATSLSVVVTLDDLARALNKMGVTESVSAASLYNTILQLKSYSGTPPFPLQPPQITPNPPQAQTAKDGQADQARQFKASSSLDIHDPVRVEKRRIMRERVKALYQNGPPPLIGLYDEKRSGGDTDVRDNHGSSE